MNQHTLARKERYFKLSSAIAQLDTERLHTLLGVTDAAPGWASNRIIEVERSKVFVKRIPVTDLEYANLFSTRNLYDLPLYYNYGVGSAGLGSFREIVTHIKTTNWVLTGAIETFPLLYHYRIVPAIDKQANMNMEQHKRYIEYWNNNAAIDRYIVDRTNAKHEALLCLEHFPHTLEAWLLKNPAKFPQMIDEMQTTIAFLRKNGIIHFDTHLHNILTDGERPYLTDFGLTLDKSFVLSEAEKLFFTQNKYYDAGEFLAGIGFHLRSIYDKLSDPQKAGLLQKYAVEADSKPWELFPILLNNVEELHTERRLRLEQSYVDSIVKYRTIIRLMRDFFLRMRQNDKKDTKFPHAKLKQLLKETGFVPSNAA